MIDYDAELRRHHHALRRALRRAPGVRRGDRVLDVGCGAGQTTRDAAAIASDGAVLGIDTAEDVLRHARRHTRAAGLPNVDYVCGDAARPPFAPASFDVAISRFGTMFFADPVRAFAAIRSGLRPTGRLVMMVWQAAHDNAWAVAIHRALIGDDTAVPEPPSGPSAFSLGDAPAVERLLCTAGFVDVAFEAVHEPVCYGPDVERAVGFVSGFANVRDAIAAQSAGQRARTLARLRDVVTAHQTPDGVWFASRAWIVTARCG